MKRRWMVLVTTGLMLAGCASGVSDAEHDKVLSELALRNQELASAQAELDRARDSAAEAAELGDNQIDDLNEELQRLQALYEQYLDGAHQNQAAQQLLLELGTAFVEFHASEREELTVQHFALPADQLGDERVSLQLDKWAASLGTESESYEYGVLGFEIMMALGSAMEPAPPAES